jgi:cell division septation protein DedD
VRRALAASAAAFALLVPAATAQAPAGARARAAVVSGSLGNVALVRATGDQRGRARARHPPAGVTLGSGLATVETSGATARATAVARSVSLLGGAVTAYGVRRSGVSGAAYRGAVRGLKIDGRLIGDSHTHETYDLDGHGFVEVNHSGVGLKVTLTAPLNGFPAGTSVSVAAVRVSVTAAVTPTPTPTPTPTATPTPEPKPVTGRRRGSATPTPTPAKKKPKPSFRQRLAGPGFVFPVRGPTRIGGPFGAARADTGFHEGNDLFAIFGTPVVAVHDGTVTKVGTLVISGNRLWLTTPHGDAFFYAHLSAFSPAAVDGNHVKAGTVLGYVGNTGDAEPTPPHLHFEIHPDGGAAVDPHPTLVVWQARARFPAPDTATRPGALEEVRDLIADG